MCSGACWGAGMPPPRCLGSVRSPPCAVLLPSGLSPHHVDTAARHAGCRPFNCSRRELAAVEGGHTQPDFGVPRGRIAARGYDAGKDGFIDLMELKLMMEKLGAPQTHLGLKNMIKEVDEDLDSKLSFREFLLIFRKAAAGELQEDSGLHALARLSEIDVSTEGVKGAKSFFEAKAQAINEASRFEEEIKAEQEEKKKQAEELKQRKAAFKELQSTFKQ
ncbi:PREDICTED: EF-hand domain-containing protein D2 isoform X1 [Calidris pugnax]|uniref:EF-hand domain-containing protein D2 isoform X1 n=1 Tax=Calidris pugnax TaxID=198806 RepID=UPI00071CB347|nr:PREDICTED: EF-hand domain-containing protein D2 isoform X1 [Calidris pugnax]